MKRFLPIFAIAVLASFALADQPEWPQWRGPENNGLAPQARPPVNWSEETNVAWKTRIPGFGLSTPIVAGHRIFLLTAVETREDADTTEMEKKQQELPGWRRSVTRAAKREHSFRVLCVDRNTGKILWNTDVRQELPNEPVHSDSSWASASPVTDGKHVWAFFGSHGLYCLDMEGNVVWQKDLGRMDTKAHFGEGASPALHGETLVINWDHEGESFLLALDKSTGEELWKKHREEFTSWSSPVIIEAGGKQQVIVSATGKSRSYDLATGKILWELGGMTVNVIPSPVYAGGRLYLASGFRGAALQCIDPAKAVEDGAAGDALLWSVKENTPYVPSIVCCDSIVYYVNFTKPELSACDARTGKVLFGPKEIEPLDGIYASLLAADGKIYVVGRQGNTAVLQHGPEAKVLSLNKLDDRFDASPVAIGTQLFLRGHRYLYCIEDAR